MRKLILLFGLLAAISAGQAQQQVPAVSWGAIPGSIDDQLDLKTRLDAKAPLANPQFTGAIAGASLALEREPHGDTGATDDFSFDTDFHTKSLTGPLTVSLSDVKADGIVSRTTIRFIQDATGGHPVTWPAPIISAAVPINPDPNSVTHITLETTDGGITFYGFSDAPVTESFGFALSDETTDITTGTAKVTFRMPYAFTVTGVRASLKTASSSGIPTVDINEGGTTILSTKLTIDADETTSKTAASAAVISDTAIADDAEMTMDIDVAGTGAKGLKVWILGHR